MSPDNSEIDSARLAVTTALLEGDSGSAFHMVHGLLDQGVPFDRALFDVVAAATPTSVPGGNGVTTGSPTNTRPPGPWRPW